MNILIAYYSRTGHTEQLAGRLAESLLAKGHAVHFEKLSLTVPIGRWRLLPPLLTFVPAFPFFLCVKTFRNWWLQHYVQPELDISELSFPDVSGFDRVCIGGPKWLYLAYPVARYLKTVQGLSGKKVGAFATFCGPPLENFELKMLFDPMGQRIEALGGETVTSLAVSSHFHEFFFFHEMEYVFRLISRLMFRRPLHHFTLDSEWGRQQIDRFCEALTRSDALLDCTD